MQIGILGPLEVRDDQDRPVPVAGARLRRLLARLALDAGRAVPVADLVDAVWPDDPPQEVANALQSLVSRLRRALGDPRLIRQVPSGYRLDVPSRSIDAARFAEDAAAGRRALRAGDPHGAAALLTSALRLWRGAPLADADGAGYASAPVARWEELRLAAATDRVDAELAMGNAAAVVPELEELVAANPLREQLVGRLMTALAATGRTADALAAYQALRDRLAEELGADPGPEISAQHLALLRGEQAPEPPSPPSHRTNLRAAVSSFVGRADELARIARLIRQGRLTTIVGPGGAGKTRLAAEAASPLVDDNRDGVWLVELAPVSDGATIAQAVLGALGVRDARILERRPDGGGGSMSATDRVLDTLAESDALLVIDNCEHLIVAVAEFTELLLARCPRLRVLATSREPLGLAGEVLVAVPPLELPPVGADASEAARYPSVQLLLARGRAANATLELTEGTAPAVVDIVRRLDGLPLAIELAAARLRVLPVTEIAERLSDRFRLLAGGLRTSVARHRTLRAVVEWSWDLLTDAERLLAERLAIFPAGASVEAAVAVCGDQWLTPGDIPDLLLALVDKSLLQVVVDGGTRYRMLETIREYGVERLDERDELGAARSRHADYFAALAHRLGPALRTREQLAALADFTAERDNMLAGLRYLGDSGDAGGATRLVLDLCWYWNITGAHSEMVTWTQFVLDATREVDSPERVRVEASWLLARIAAPASATEDSWAGLQERLTRVAERLAVIDDGRDPLTSVVRTYVEFFGSRGGANVEQLLAAGRSSPDPWLRAMTTAMHVMYLENNGDVARLRGEVDAAYTAFSEIGDRWGLSTVVTARAGLRAMDGDVDGALADYQAALHYIQQLQATEDDMFVQLKMAGLRLRQGDFAAAHRHVAAVRTGRPGRPVPMERTLLADTARIGVLLAENDVRQAAAAAAELRKRTPSSLRSNPMDGHLITLIGAVCAMAAAAAGDLRLARSDLRGAYPAAVAIEDRPLIAALAVSVAAYAEAIGRPVDGAEILGAAAALRGADDLGDVGVARVREQLVAALGPGTFDRHYADGASLGPDIAAKRIDPALLDDDEEPVPAASAGRSPGRSG